MAALVVEPLRIMSLRSQHKPLSIPYVFPVVVRHLKRAAVRVRLFFLENPDIDGAFLPVKIEQGVEAVVKDGMGRFLVVTNDHVDVLSGAVWVRGVALFKNGCRMEACFVQLVGLQAVIALPAHRTVVSPNQIQGGMIGWERVNGIRTLAPVAVIIQIGFRQPHFAISPILNH